MAYPHGKTLIKIAVAEDHNMLREAICTMIDTWENCKVILQAENGKELIEQVEQKNLPDLVLMDLAMPEMNGYDCIDALKKIYPAIKIMVVSMYQSEEAILHLIKLGAQGFFNKTGDINKFRKAVYEIMDTGYYFADHSASRLMKKAMETGHLRLRNDLSPEELAFLMLIITDKTYKEIAGDLNVSLRHVEYLREKMFDRFETQSRIGLAVQVIKKGLVV